MGEEKTERMGAMESNDNTKKSDEGAQWNKYLC